jgi:hypothetical protein
MRFESAKSCGQRGRSPPRPEMFSRVIIPVGADDRPQDSAAFSLVGFGSALSSPEGTYRCPGRSAESRTVLRNRSSNVVVG